MRYEKNLFLEKLNSGGKWLFPLVEQACLHIIIFTLTPSVGLAAFSSSPHLQIIPQSPAGKSSCFILVSRFHLPHSGRRSGTCSIRQPEAEGERKILSVPSTRAENVVGHVFLQRQFHVCINKVPTLTLALLKVSSCYKLPKPSLSHSFTLLLSSFLAVVLPFPLFLSNSTPPLFSSSLSLIRTGSRVIDVSAEVRTTASITVGISSPVMRWWHRRCSHSSHFTASGGNRRTSLKYSHHMTSFTP